MIRLPLDNSDQSSEETCLKCGNPATLINRKEAICDDCFNKFIQGKLRKSLMSDIYKMNSRHGIHKVMIAYSGSGSSLATLNMMYDLLCQQRGSRGTPGFELSVINIEEFDLRALDQSISDNFSQLQQKYEGVEFKVIEPKDHVKLIKEYSIDKQFNILISETSSVYDDIFNIDKSTREDLLEVWYDRILMDVAISNGYGTILYCDTMNQMAVESLSLIIKGRGTKMPNKVDDTQINNIWIRHPIKELFKGEVEYYLEINQLTQVIRSQEMVSNINKNMTIKQIVNRYLNNVERDGYVSTVPTVVKISEKLIAPTKFEQPDTCRICGDGIYQDSKTWLNRITVNEPAPLTTPEELENYRLYKEQEETKAVEKVNDSKVCYGCMINMPFNWVE